MTSLEAARLIDISAVRTHHSIDDITEIVDIAKKYRFINVHVLPSWVKELSDLISSESDIYVGAPVGFPSGGHTTTVKLEEAKRLIKDGVQEMDIVMNIGRFKNKQYDYVVDELTQIVKLAPKDVLTKVIIEINTLSDDEVVKACECVMSSGADFVKTGTGWIAGDANIDRIRKIMEICDSKIKVKAAGGIRTLQEFKLLCEMGVQRMGINSKSAIEIVEQLV
ncbi:MAG: deoxyribose-phosphate aldolase [Oscillospiraceae bacterium]|nr:deoxyribose-phosphate aldolase [Oscillospiraceae bacterium]